METSSGLTYKAGKMLLKHVDLRTERLCVRCSREGETSMFQSKNCNSVDCELPILGIKFGCQVQCHDSCCIQALAGDVANEFCVKLSDSVMIQPTAFHMPFRSGKYPVGKKERSTLLHVFFWLPLLPPFRNKTIPFNT